ncbi:hypothetical protein RB653_006426 [Dictyostelium firmibasis]|uniref:Uncharacterized protein n=1 Tax=Dictyostelium firmibasis TaxID=79012 RepID=A0AAN7YTQ1_9MYCE
MINLKSKNNKNNEIIITTTTTITTSTNKSPNTLSLTNNNSIIGNLSPTEVILVGINPMKCSKPFNNDFEINEEINKKLDSLIEKKDFKKIKSMIVKGERFYLTQEQYIVILLFCHDTDFYEKIFRYGLLFDTNLIKLSVLLNEPTSLDLMINVFANGWNNHRNVGFEFYKNILRFAIENNTTNTPTNRIISFMAKKVNKTDIAFILANYIKQQFDQHELNQYQDRDNQNKLIFSCDYIGTLVLRINVLEEVVNDYFEKLMKIHNHIVQSKKKIQDIDEYEYFESLLYRREVEISATLETEKFERSKLYGLQSSYGLSDKIEKFIFEYFDLTMDKAIKDISKKVVASRIPFTSSSQSECKLYPKFHLLGFLKPEHRAIFEKHNYYSEVEYGKLGKYKRVKNLKYNDLSLIQNQSTIDGYKSNSFGTVKNFINHNTSFKTYENEFELYDWADVYPFNKDIKSGCLNYSNLLIQENYFSNNNNNDSDCNDNDDDDDDDDDENDDEDNDGNNSYSKYYSFYENDDFGIEEISPYEIEESIQNINGMSGYTFKQLKTRKIKQITPPIILTKEEIEAQKEKEKEFEKQLIEEKKVEKSIQKKKKKLESAKQKQSEIESQIKKEKINELELEKKKHDLNLEKEKKQIENQQKQKQKQKLKQKQQQKQQQKQKNLQLRISKSSPSSYISSSLPLTSSSSFASSSSSSSSSLSCSSSLASSSSSVISSNVSSHGLSSSCSSTSSIVSSSTSSPCQNSIDSEYPFIVISSPTIISTNLITKFDDNFKALEINNNFKTNNISFGVDEASSSYYHSNQLKIENDNYDDDIDPNIQHEIDVKVSSLVDDNNDDDCESEGETIESYSYNIINNYFQTI